MSMAQQSQAAGLSRNLGDVSQPWPSALRGWLSSSAPAHKNEKDSSQVPRIRTKVARAYVWRKMGAEGCILIGNSDGEW